MGCIKFIIMSVSTLYLVEGEDNLIDALQGKFDVWLLSGHKSKDYSIESFDKLKTGVEYYHQLLLNIPRHVLPEKSKTEYDILEDFLMTYLRGYEWRFYNSLNPINAFEIPSSGNVGRIGKNPTRAKFEKVISRIHLLSRKIQQMQSRFELAVQYGHTYHNLSIYKVPGILEKRIKSRPEDSRFYSPFRDELERLTSISSTDKSAIRTRAKSAIGQYFESLENLTNYLKYEYFLNLRKSFGVHSWDKGKEFYKAALRYHLSLPLTPEEAHQKGLDEIKRISEQMKTVMSRLGFNGTIKEMWETIRKDNTFFFKASEEMIDRYNNIINKEIYPKLGQFFKNIPDLPVVARPLGNDDRAGRYGTGSSDGSSPGVFWVNVNHPDKSLRTEFMPLALHESIPGHHLQMSILMLSNFRKFRTYSNSNRYFQAPALFPLYTAFKEGWPVYAESLGEEMGLYYDDYDLLGKYSSEILRACRLVADTGIHYMGWSKLEAIDLMLQYTDRSEQGISTDLDRYITWPGHASAYTIGLMKIRELRERATLALGHLFDIRDFHSVVLENGYVPLTVLEKVVDRWINRTKKESIIQ